MQQGNSPRKLCVKLRRCAWHDGWATNDAHAVSCQYGSCKSLMPIVLESFSGALCTVERAISRGTTGLVHPLIGADLDLQVITLQQLAQQTCKHHMFARQHK